MRGFFLTLLIFFVVFLLLAAGVPWIGALFVMLVPGWRSSKDVW